MTQYSDITKSYDNNKSENRREVLLTDSEHRKKVNDKQKTVRTAARSKQNISNQWAKEIADMPIDELIKLIKTLPTYEKRTVNSTCTLNRKEVVIMNLAKKLSGKSVRQILIDSCEDIIRSDNSNH